MGAIAGSLDLTAGSAPPPGRVEAMLAAMAHRGHAALPVVEQPGLALGALGRAPGAAALAAAGGLLLALDGAVFNGAELRRALGADAAGIPDGDPAALVLALYRRHGEDFLDRLNGDFALALWDGRRRRLLLARDRAGVRPLFHARVGGRLWFASEAGALLQACPELRSLDPEAVAETFVYWAPVEPASAFRGVHSLPPGHRLAIEAGGRERLEPWWDWEFPAAGTPPPFASPDEAAEALLALLDDAVGVRMQGTAPGVYLSGGLDSAALAALAVRRHGGGLQSFSLAFAEAGFDESAEQAGLAAALGIESRTLAIDGAQIGEAFPRFMRHVQMPVLRTAGAPLMLLAQAAREAGCHAVLTGEGADEVFAGYDLFREAKIRRWWARQPDSSWRPLLLARLYEWLDAASPVGSPALARGFFGRHQAGHARPAFAHLTRWGTSQRALAFLAPELRERWRGRDVAARYEAALPAASAGWAPLARDQYIEAKSLLGAHLLPAQGDRPAGACGLETRLPFLDHRLIGFGNTLPPRWKLRVLEEKHLLRRALAGVVPEGVRRRRKQPYRAPDAASFFRAGEPLEYVAALFTPQRLEASGLFDADACLRLLEKCRRGRAGGFADNQAFVGILSTLLLDEAFVRGTAFFRHPEA